MNRKLLVTSLALVFATAAYADDLHKPAYQEAPEGDPEVLHQGPSGKPVHPQVRDMEGSPSIARQGPEGAPASAKPDFELGPEHINQAGGESAEERAGASVFYSMDKDSDGYINQAEADAELKSNWSQVDQNSDGKIDAAEFSAFEASGKGQKTQKSTPAMEMDHGSKGPMMQQKHDDSMMRNSQ